MVNLFKFLDKVMIATAILFFVFWVYVAGVLMNAEIQCKVHGYRYSVITSLTLYCVDWNNYIWPLSGIDK